jgi:hypothetical protein
MLKRTSLVLIIVAIFALLPTWPMPETVIAQQKAAASKPQPEDKLALGEKEVKELLLLMDTDKNGKISKEEYMKFMEAEFDRLDKDKSGDLDVKELKQSKLRVSHASVGR